MASYNMHRSVKKSFLQNSYKKISYQEIMTNHDQQLPCWCISIFEEDWHLYFMTPYHLIQSYLSLPLRFKNNLDLSLHSN